MEHKEIFAVVIAVIAVIIVLGILGTLRAKKTQTPEVSQIVVTESVTLPARTTSYWEYLREQESKSQTEVTGTDVTGETTQTEITGVSTDNAVSDAVNDQTDAAIHTEVVTNVGSDQQAITTAASQTGNVPGFTLNVE